MLNTPNLNRIKFLIILSWAACLTTGISPLQADEIIDIEDGDVSGLNSAIERANQSGERTFIRLVGDGAYSYQLPENSPPKITGTIILDGKGAVFSGDGSTALGPLLEIGEGGSLELSNVVIRDFESDQPGTSEQGLIIVSDGASLSLESVRISSVDTHSSGKSSGAVVLNYGNIQLSKVRASAISVVTESQYAVVFMNNLGEATLENVFIIDGRIDAPELPAQSVAAYIHNGPFATLNIRSSTFIRETSPSGTTSKLLAIERTVERPGVFREIAMGGTMILDLGCTFSENVVSTGFNLISTTEPCPAKSNTDITGFYSNAARFENAPQGGPFVVLPPNSPALDRITGDTYTCPNRDAMGGLRPKDGTGDGISQCDIGAFETSGNTPLFSGGENGLFYSRGRDGHYVTIENTRPNEYLIFWNTFDQSGNQGWVLGIGSRSGNTILADGYYQTEGILTPGAGADVNTSEMVDWGSIRIELESCLNGRFIYDSLLSEFGSGAFTLDRLAYIEGLGCLD
ncbi:choice-of-anchor Q domain-containing protein [Elongatibacter sediminis]|uniref:Choice-of-anchor Q domain-containing protein n=1 Tax=Elongatibacter sediminis TaxID=3119006 RepID=A0AAW9RE75_9GAMM